MNITVNQTTSLDTSIAFNFLANNFNLKLYSIYDGEVYEILSGDAEALNESSKVNFRQVINTVLSPGQYQLQIIEETASSTKTNEKPMCYPYIFYILLIPLDGTTFVSSIVPAANQYIPPTGKLVINIGFSDVIYTNTKKMISQNLDYLKQNVYLSSNASQLYPVAVTGSIQGTSFTLSFDAANLISTVSYHLAAKANTIYDINNKEVYLPSSNQYQALNCGSYGKLVGSQCQCNDGFTGIDCSSCTFGYIPSLDGICTNNFCQSGFCNSFGTCYVDTISQTPKCNCSTSYNGSNCEKCADNYHGYPSCAINAKCPECVINNGKCNLDTGMCDCFEQYAGNTCEKCASGYVGDNCERVAGGSGVGAIIAVVIAITVIGVVAFLLVKRYRLKKKQDPQSYVPVTLETIDDKDDDEENEDDKEKQKNNDNDDETDKKMEISDLFQPTVGDKFKSTASTMLESSDFSLSRTSKKDKKKKDIEADTDTDNDKAPLL